MRKAGKGCWVGNYVHRCGSRRPLRFSRVLSNYRRLVRSALRVQKAIVLSQYLADTLLQVGFSIDRIKVVPPAILVGSPIPLKNPGQENKDILFIGRLEWYKGIQYLLQASKMVGNAHRILVVGDGPYMPNLKMLAADLGVENRTIFLGARTSDEISQIYRRSKVVVVPSIVQETFGRVVVEAMAHGKPVVAFNVGAVSEWLEDSKTGFLIKPGDIHTLAKKLEFLLSEAEIADEMGQCGEEMIKSNLSREIHLKGLLGAYQEAIDAYGDVT